jgi:hypothetical protein
MFNPNAQAVPPLLAVRSSSVAEGSSTPGRSRAKSRIARRPRPNVVRLIPGVTKLPIGYSPR